MLNVVYQGIQGVVISERSIEGIPFNTWIVKLANGELVEVVMHECIILTESVDLTGVAV